MRGRGVRLASLVGVTLLVLAACGDETDGNTDPEQVDTMEAPELGACRVLTPADIGEPSNATRTVDCEEHHTAETYATGELPEDLHDVDYESEKLGAFAYELCGDRF